MSSHSKYELVAYYDEEYRGSYLDPISKDLLAGLRKRLSYLQEKNAEQLKNWMRSVIEKDAASKTVLIFSQDIVPDTIYESGDSSCLVRRYLDLGGKVIWLGDIPLYNEGKKGKKIEARGIGPAYNALGVLTLFVNSPKRGVELAKDWNEVLTKRWNGTRPIIPERKGGIFGRKDITVIGWTRPNYLVNFAFHQSSFVESHEEKGPKEETAEISFGPVKVPLSRRALSYIVIIKVPILIGALGILFLWFGYDAIISSLRSLPLLWHFAIGILLVAVSALYGYSIYLHRLPKYASAWIKFFGEGQFVRIWDCPLRQLTNGMLDDLERLINKLMSDSY